MGAGKSTIGKALASTLGYKFYDTDHLVEKGFKKRIARIFEENGETDFRKAERLVLKTLSTRDKVIISTGGGTLSQPELFYLAKDSGLVVYLRAPIVDLYERVIFSPKQRPVIDVPDTEQVFEQTFEVRRQYYEKADIIVDTAKRHVQSVVNDIIEAVKPFS